MVRGDWPLRQVEHIDPEDRAAIRLEILPAGRHGWVISLRIPGNAPDEFMHASLVQLLEVAAALADRYGGQEAKGGTKLVLSTALEAFSPTLKRSSGATLGVSNAS